MQQAENRRQDRRVANALGAYIFDWERASRLYRKVEVRQSIRHDYEHCLAPKSIVEPFVMLQTPCIQVSDGDRHQEEV